MLIKGSECYRSDDRDIFLSIRAKCTTCGAILIGAMESEPMENDLVFIEFDIRGLDVIRQENAPTKNVRVGVVYAQSLYGKN